MNSASVMDWGLTLASLGESLQDAGGSISAVEFANMHASELITLLAENRIRFHYDPLAGPTKEIQ